MPNQDYVADLYSLATKTPRKLRPYEKVNILNKAIKVLEGGWTRGCEARDKHNEDVDPRDPSAIRFCAVGAVQRVTKCERYRSEIINALENNLTNGEFLTDFNDEETRRKRDVIRLFKRTIKNIKNPVE